MEYATTPDILSLPRAVMTDVSQSHMEWSMSESPQLAVVPEVYLCVVCVAVT